MGLAASDGRLKDSKIYITRPLMVSKVRGTTKLAATARGWGGSDGTARGTEKK